MSTFEQLAEMPGVVSVYLIEVSSDEFSTVSRRWSTADCEFDSFSWDGRIASVGSLSRALGARSGATSATVSVVLDNTDAGADWLMSAASFVSTMAQQFRLSVMLANPLDLSDSDSATLGVFGLFDPPSRDDSSVMLHLGDAISSRCVDSARRPTYRDFYAAGTLPSTLPGGQYPFGYGFNQDDELPLHFGLDAIPLRLLDGGHAVLCCSKSAPSMTVGQIIDKNGMIMPFTPIVASSSTGLTFGGATWYLRYIPIELATLRTNPVVGIAYPAIHNYTQGIETLGLAFKGCPYLSSTAPDADFGVASTSPAAIAYSLLASYSGLASSRVDKASFVLAQGARQVSATGSIGGTSSPIGGELGSALSALASLGGFDIISVSDGSIKASVIDLDFAAASADVASVDDSDVNDLSDRLPYSGERWSPSGGVRVVSGDGKSSIASTPGQEQLPLASISIGWIGPTDGIIDPGWEAGWSGRLSQLAGYELKLSAPRPRISFRAGLACLAMDVGSFFEMGWDRGSAGVAYALAFWRVEFWSLDPSSGVVSIDATWCEDLRDPDVAPYLLDNEALTVRVSDVTSGAGDATVTDGSLVVAFDLPGGDTLLDYGVEVGDVLVLQDASETFGFLRNRCMRIASIDGFSPECTVIGSSDFGTAGTHAVAAWSIMRGATNAVAIGDDPTNYPLGGGVYGRVSDENGLFSDSSQANIPTE